MDAFMVLLASMVAHAPSLVDRVPGAKFLGLIAGDENSYFLRSFDALGLSEAEINAPPAPVTKRFDALMRNAAGSGKLHEMLAVLVVAEWSYLTWGEAAKPVAGLSWLHLEWIDLHRGDYFASVIAYLRGQLDKLELTGGAAWGGAGRVPGGRRLREGVLGDGAGCRGRRALRDCLMCKF